MGNLFQTGNPDNPPATRLAVRLLVVALAYFVSGRLGLAMPYLNSHLTLIWLPTGIAVAALMRWGYSCWPGIFLGALATNFSIDHSPLLDCGIALGNTLGPLLAAWLLYQSKFHCELDRVRDILMLVAAAAIGMLVSASGGVSSLVIFKELPVQQAGTAWMTWWGGDFVGVLLAAPLLLNISRAELKLLDKQRGEFALFCMVTLALSWGVFFNSAEETSYLHHLIFVLFPPIVWASMRFGIMTSALSLLIPMLVGAMATQSELGPFQTEDDARGMFLLWLFFFTSVLIELMVAALQAGRKQAEKSLQQSEQQLRAIIETEPECVKLLARDGTVLQMNAAGLRMLEADSPGQIIGQKAQGIVTPQYRSAFSSLMQRVFEGESGQLEFEVVGLKGHHRWLETYEVPLRDAQGNITSMLGITRNISERKESESKLEIMRAREAEALQELRVMLNISGEGFWKLEKSGNILEANDAYCTIIGYPKDEVVGAHIAKFEANELTPEIIVAHIQRIMKLGTDRFETRHRHRDGHLIDLEIVASYIHETDCLIAFMHDVSERKQVEELLRVAAITFETQEAILVTDPDGNILRVNKAFQEITGYGQDEAIGRNPRIFQSGLHDAAFYLAMWSELLGTGKWSGEVWDRRKDGSIYPKLMTITAVYDDRQQLTHFVAVFRDISNRKESELEIHRLAFFDSLTQLPNRRLLMDRLQQALAVSARNNRHGALLFLDLDHFKTINDTQGHAMGDQLLIEVARRLQTCVREGDSVSRLGGDEFVVMLGDLSSKSDEAVAQTELVAEKIREELDKPYVLTSFECLSTVSIGISLFLNHHETADDLLRHADVAMYQAKMAGRNAIRFFDPQMQTVLEARAALESDLRHALEKHQFRPFYQIQVDKLRRPIGAEVLLRWTHPERGMVSPMQFIPLAEETGQILPIGLWVLQTACAQLKTWQNDPLTRDLTLAVNVSGKQLRQADFAAQVRLVLLESGAQPSRLKLELTESVVLENVEETINKMLEVTALGVGFSMDDFGTGYSSLQYLKRLPLNQIKIDQSFVRDIATDPNDAAIVQTIIAMSQTLGLNVIAEGVETEAQREFLELRGCSTYQGYLFSKPVPLDEFERLLKRS